MKTILLIVKLLYLLPPVAIGPTEAPLLPAAAFGSGFILVANCRPGSQVLVEPGHLRGVAEGDGAARIQAPAQSENAEPYKIYAMGSSIEVNGTLRAGESISTVCP